MIDVYMNLFIFNNKRVALAQGDIYQMYIFIHTTIHTFVLSCS